MPKIVQFHHTHKEATPKRGEDFIEWNNSNEHRRKFLLSNGNYIDRKGKLLKDELVFWGEWEAQSEVEKLNNKLHKHPKYLNRPLLNSTVKSKNHNTDPYVFGDNFRYIVCQQKKSIILKNLEPYSIVLFGSSINGEFCLDTLFVVTDDTKRYHPNKIKSVYPQKDQYFYASVEPISRSNKHNNGCGSKNELDCYELNNNTEYAFYRGVNYNSRDEYKGIYSFVPSKKYVKNNESEYIFKQPRIDLDFISHGQTQGINAAGTREFSKEEIVEYWEEIDRQLSEAGLIKGVSFVEPNLITRNSNEKLRRAS